MTWWSGDERDSNQLGAQDRPSSKGDSVGGYSSPVTTFEAPAPQGGRFKVTYSAADQRLYVAEGSVAWISLVDCE